MKSETTLTAAAATFMTLMFIHVPVIIHKVHFFSQRAGEKLKEGTDYIESNVEPNHSLACPIKGKPPCNTKYFDITEPISTIQW